MRTKHLWIESLERNFHLGGWVCGAECPPTVSELPMAATTTPTPATSRPPGFRLSTMEVLGFIETPGSAMISTFTWMEAAGSATPPSSQADTDDPFSGWQPEEFGARLIRGRVRWGMAAALTGLMVLLSLGGLWVYQRPQVQAERARDRAMIGVAELESAAAGLASINATLTAPSMDAVQVNTLMLSADAAVRQVFAAAAALPSSLGMAKARLLDASGDVSDALRLFGDAYAYRSGAVLLLMAPLLESDPGLTTLEVAAAEFSQWQANFETRRSNLPNGPLPNTSTALASISAELADIQRAYLDALRMEDATEAGVALDRLSGRLAAIEAILFDDLEGVHSGVARLLEEAGGDLEAIRSLLG